LMILSGESPGPFERRRHWKRESRRVLRSATKRIAHKDGKWLMPPTLVSHPTASILLRGAHYAGAHLSLLQLTELSLAPGFSRVFGAMVVSNRFSGLVVRNR